MRNDVEPSLEFELGTRVFNQLARTGRWSIREICGRDVPVITGAVLASITDDDLLAFRNIGVLALAHIREFYPYRLPVAEVAAERDWTTELE